MTAGLNIELAGVALSTSLTPIPASSYQTGGPVPDCRGSEAASSPVRKVWCAETFQLGARKAKFPEELQEDLTERFFPKPRQGWECRWSKPPNQHPDFRHKKSRVPLWLKHQPKPVNVDSQLARIDDVVKQTGCNSVQRSGALRLTEGHVNVRMCRELCDSGLIHDAVEALNLLVQRGCPVSNNLFYRLLKGCIKDMDLALGRRVHALTVRSGYEGDAFLATHLISFYALHGRLEEAMGVFRKVSTPSVYNWATIIFAYARHGEAAEAAKAVTLYRQMCESTTIHPDDRLYTAVLKACASAKDLVVGKEIHARILASSRKPDPFVEAGLVNMYAKCGSVGDARKLFDQLSDRNVVTWTAMIAGYAQQGMGHEALSLHRRMRQEGLTPPNCVTYACLLQACATIGAGALREGQQLHAEIEKQGLQDDVVVGGSLVNMYAKCGSIGDARLLFDKLPSRNVVTWTAMISGYAQEGMAREAISMYRSMRQEGLTPPDSVTYVCLLQACASVGVGALDEGKQLHAQIRERGLQEDVVLGGSLVNMYAKCGRLEEAWSVFDKLSNRGVVTWTAMIAGYVQQGMGQEALSLYRSMRKEGLTPNSVTCVCLLQACASTGLEGLDEGKQLHTEIKNQGLEEDVVVGGSLVNLYSKCGNLEVARSLFDRLPDRNVVAWNAMIAGYAQQGMGQEALSLSKGMRQEGLYPDCVTYVSLLQACSGVGAGAHDEGKRLHAEITEQGLQEDVIVGSSLINMYANCGSLEEAQKVFDNLSNRDAVTWTAMIAAYAEQGMGREALTLYQSMQDDGVTPISSTYVCLLQACASVGEEALREGKQLHAEIEEQGLEKDAAVGSSLVNMYAKCGRVEEAQIVFDKLPNRDVVTWTTMIAGYAQQGICSPRSTTPGRAAAQRD